MENTVIFKKVKEKYDIGQPVEFKYVMSESVEMSERDWVGLYRVEEADTGVRDGETKESRDRGRELVTYVWVPALRGSFKGQTVCSSVYFEAATLPTDTESTYCVRYVASTGDVCGESPPFHFAVTSMREEQDLVAITDGDLLIIKTKAEAMSDELDQWVDSRLPDELIKEFVVEKGVCDNLVDKLSDLDFEEDSSPEDLESDEDSLPEDNKENSKTDLKTISDSKVEARLGCTDEEDEFDSFQASSISEQEFSEDCIKAVSHFDDLSDLDLTPAAEQVHPLLTESCGTACSLADRVSQGEDRVTQAGDMVAQDEVRLSQGEDKVSHRKDSETQSVNFGGQDMVEQVRPCERTDGLDEVILPKISVELHPKPSSKMHIELLEQKVLELEKLLEEERNTVHHLRTQDIHMRIIVEKLHSELKTEIENNSRLRQHLTDKAVTSLYDEPYVPSCSGLGLSSRLSLGKEESSTNKEIPALPSSVINPLICHQVGQYQKMSDIKHGSHSQEAIHKQPMTSVNHSEATQEQPNTAINNSVSTPDQQTDSAAIGCEAAEDRCLICEAAGQDRIVDGSLGGAKSNSIVAKLRGIPLLLRHLKGGVNWLISDDECDETMEAVCLNNQSQDSTEGMIKEVLKIESGSKVLELSGDTCPICDEVFSSVLSKTDISAHVDSHRGTYCPLCFTRFTNVGQDRLNSPRVVNHGGLGHGNGLRLVECYTQTDE